MYNFKLTEILSAPLRDDKHLVAVEGTSLKRTLGCHITIIPCIHSMNTCNVFKLIQLRLLNTNLRNHMESRTELELYLVFKSPDFALKLASYSLICCIVSSLTPEHLNPSV